MTKKLSLKQFLFYELGLEFFLTIQETKSLLFICSSVNSILCFFNFVTLNSYCFFSNWSGSDFLSFGTKKPKIKRVSVIKKK